jgi:phosphoglucosamine mutase
VIDGDTVMALCATRMLASDTLAHRTVVATVMSNLGFERAIQAAGGTVVRTQVGDRYVVDEMRRGGFNFGGEQSGHLVFLDHSTTGDGIVSALRVLSILVRERTPLSELAQVMTRTPQVLVNVKVGRKVPFEEVPDIHHQMMLIERELGRDGRLLVRYSGTELKARVMIEGLDEVKIRQYAEELAATIARVLTA